MPELKEICLLYRVERSGDSYASWSKNLKKRGGISQSNYEFAS